MFQSTRLKLTAWYLAIIMLISCFFSIAIYRGISLELSRLERFQGLRREHVEQELGLPVPRTNSFDPQMLTDARNNLKLNLLLINLGILVIAGSAGYFLAARTLKPIADMVEEQNRFITDASHELRTPITVLKSELEVNLRDRNLNQQSVRSLLLSNLEEVNNLQNLSDNLIKLTQYQKTANGLNFEILSVVQVVNEAIKKVSPMAKAKNIEIKSEVKNIKITADRQSLCELFVILLDNAIKYSSKKTKVTIGSKYADSNILINIKDQGIGIDKKDIPNLFKRFYRGDKSRTKTNVSGYGLGLSIAQQIAAKHHGNIKVESSKSGSIFSVFLPKKL